MNDCKQSAKKSPGRADVSTQSPVGACAQRAGREQNACPRSTRNGASKGQHEPLSQRVNRAIGWLLQDEEGFEEAVERVGRIGQAKMQQGVSNEKMAEFVVHIRDWNRMARQ